MLHKIPLPVLIPFLVPSLFKIQPAHSGRQCLHRCLIIIITVPSSAASAGALAGGGGYWGRVGLVAGGGSGGVRDGDGVGRCGPCYRGSDGLGEFLKVGVIEVFALRVEFEESVRVVVSGVGLRRRFVEVVRWESMSFGLGFYKRDLGN